ncbi:MAG: ThuA domain-containing protein [Actinobacteria bacterium]|nr:ThuA domain-containing protein [Actinomycetota bacterium]
MTAYNLLISGGVAHDFTATSRMVADILTEVDIASEITDDVESGLRRLADEPVDLVTVNALRWRMEGAERYAHLSDEWGLSLSDAARAALVGHLDAGRPLLALHAAAICFDDWDHWGFIVGARWDWGRSTHPPVSEAAITVRTDAHPIVAGVDDFEIVDEVYGFMAEQPDIEPLALSAHGGRDHPLLWARTLPGGARVVYDALGHDERSLAHPSHRRIVRRAAAWALGRPDDVVRTL